MSCLLFNTSPKVVRNLNMGPQKIMFSIFTFRTHWKRKLLLYDKILVNRDSTTHRRSHFHIPRLDCFKLRDNFPV